ncbi:hypothetical protein OIDMADRAFT_185116 [Oidiodendron maius Zn]|uniref:Uncharacterized protein n=1 Tax=Oidiodendron maius (strain Zn) TaxID=913774 RepID=A0A0C3CS91_OIDMZ|nr:hypothetical protein OIDMADRAFT_185116 [Oidiodendron maius Zn]
MPGGRPRKYADRAIAKEANRAKARARYHTVKQEPLPDKPLGPHSGSPRIEPIKLTRPCPLVVPKPASKSSPQHMRGKQVTDKQESVLEDDPDWTDDYGVVVYDEDGSGGDNTTVLPGLEALSLGEQYAQVQPRQGLEQPPPSVTTLPPPKVPNPLARPPQSGPPLPATASALHLIRQLQRPYTCSEEAHKLRLKNHLYRIERHRHTRHECSSLADIRDIVDPTLPANSHIPHPLSRRDITIAGKQKGLHPSDLDALPGPLKTEGLYRDPRFAQLYEGREAPPARPRNACLHLNEESRLGRTLVPTFDIDSICGWASSLAVCKQGLRWLPKGLRVTNIQNNIHGIYLRIDQEPKGGGPPQPVPVAVHKIPHLCLGRVISLLGINLYVFFPRIYRARLEIDKLASNFLTDNEESLWLDGVFIPALATSVPRYTLQRFPLSWAAATANSLASGAERVGHPGEGGRQQLLGEVIQPQYLQRLWQNIEGRIAEYDTFDLFRGCQLFFNGKDFKADTSSSSWDDLHHRWSRLWAQTIDEAYCNRDRYWVDIGRQLNPPDSFVFNEEVDGTIHEPECLSWKLCCLGGYYQDRLGDRPQHHLRKDVYHLALLRDTGAVTFTPSVQSREWADGFLYSQFYCKAMSVFTVATVQTFANQKLEMLALDPDYIAGVQEGGRGGVIASLDALTTMYLRGKDRAYQNLLNATHLSYGTREEHRVSGALYTEVIPALIGLPIDESLIPVTAQLPHYTIPSMTLFGFLHGQVNKFCLGFESTMADITAGYTRWEETQAATVFLRALRHSSSTSPVQQESLLWRDRWESKGLSHEGLNVGGLMQRTGLGWFQPKFDWETWTLLPVHADHMLLENPRLLQHYQQNWSFIRSEKDVYVRLQQVARWLGKVKGDSIATRVVLDYVTGLCLGQFRTDVYQHLVRGGCVKSEFVEAAMVGRLALCHKTLRGVLNDGEPWLVTGNKSFVKDIRSLVDYLFDAEPFTYVKDGVATARSRLHWESMTYRSLYAKAGIVVEEEVGEGARAAWQRSFKSAVLALNYILPYPDYNTFFSKTKCRRGRGLDTVKKTRRCWMAVWTLPAGAIARLAETDPAPWQIWNLLEWLEPPSADSGPSGPSFSIGGKRKEGADIEREEPPATHFEDSWQGLTCAQLERVMEPLLGDAPIERDLQLPPYKMPPPPSA